MLSEEQKDIITGIHINVDSEGEYNNNCITFRMSLYRDTLANVFEEIHYASVMHY